MQEIHQRTRLQNTSHCYQTQLRCCPCCVTEAEVPVYKLTRKEATGYHRGSLGTSYTFTSRLGTTQTLTGVTLLHFLLLPKNLDADQYKQ